MVGDDEAIAIVQEFLAATFAGGLRRRSASTKSAKWIARANTNLDECAVFAWSLIKMDTKISQHMNRPLEEVDPDIAEVLRDEGRRQGTGLELIPSENFVSEAVLEAMGSVLTNKYAEGYPGKRYYGGCEFADRAEQLAIDRAKALFGAEHANVQSHSGTQANVSVYMAALQPGDTVLGMNLAHGGHLTHGHPLNFLLEKCTNLFLMA